MDYYRSSSTNSNSYGVLELCLADILALIKPLDNDRVQRLNVINNLATLVRSTENLNGAVVKPFGSFLSNLFTKWGDLDLSVELSSSDVSIGRSRKQRLLKNIMKALRRNGGAYNIQFIPSARVPLLIFKSNYENISGDVSIDNHLGCIKSKILLWLTDIDDRFRDIVLLTKEWAKAQNINDPKTGTLNSYSLCLLVIFHFQTCQPALLPPLEEIYGGNIGDDVTGESFITEQDIADTYAFADIKTHSSNYVICTYTGRWENITKNYKWMEKPHSLFIEDPFEQPDNAARAVGLRELLTISDAFSDAHRKLGSRPTLERRSALLDILVNPSIRPQVGSGRVEYSGANFSQVGSGRVGYIGANFVVPWNGDSSVATYSSRSSSAAVATPQRQMAENM